MIQVAVKSEHQPDQTHGDALDTNPFRITQTTLGYVLSVLIRIQSEFSELGYASYKSKAKGSGSGGSAKFSSILEKLPYHRVTAHTLTKRHALTHCTNQTLRTFPNRFGMPDRGWNVNIRHSSVNILVFTACKNRGKPSTIPGYTIYN